MRTSLLAGLGRAALLAPILAPIAHARGPAQLPGDLPARGPHNVILILADDVGVDMIGAYEPLYDEHPARGYENRTPAIDSLARDGLLFRSAWTNPLCSPTRAQVLTGRPASRSGVGAVVRISQPLPLGGASGLQHELTTLPALLREAPAPYRSAALGKWHLADSTQHPPGPEGSPARLHPLGSGANPWFDHFAGKLTGSNNYNTWRKSFGTPIDPATDECFATPGSWCSAISNSYRSVDTADDAIHLMGSLPEPFFLYVAFLAAHVPLQAPDERLPVAGCPRYAGGGDHGEFTDGDDPAVDTRCLVSWMDSQIARVLCALESSPVRPELPTTVIFMGDNGTLGQAIVPPFERTHGKGSLYEGGVNVPLIVRSPLIPDRVRGRTSDAIVGSTDLYATVAELAGAELPADPYRARDSVSIVPYLRGEKRALRDHVVVERFSTNFAPTPEGLAPDGHTVSFHRRAIRDARGFKLIQRLSGSPQGTVIEEELYDLREDPFEAVDLMPRVRSDERLAAILLALRRRLEDGYPSLLPL